MDLEVKRLKRELTYSTVSLISLPSLYLSLGSSFADHFDSIQANHELPFDAVFGVGLVEALKLLLSVWFYPTQDLLNPNADTIGTGLKILGSGDVDGKNFFRLPYSKRDTGAHSYGKLSSADAPDKTKQVIFRMVQRSNNILSISPSTYLIYRISAPGTC
jgi:hypothetical protein